METGELDVESAVGDIASELGLQSEDAPPRDEPADDQPADDTPADDTAAPAEPAAAAPQPRPAPKAWAKEYHEHWTKLDPKVQDLIELREKQAIDGISQYQSRAAEWDNAVKDFMPIIQAQGIKPHEAVRYLFQAHKELSTGTPEQRVAYLQKVAQQYGIDLAKAAAAPAAAEEPAAVKELRERTERLERERQQEREARAKEAAERVEREVSAFAEAKDEQGNLKHPYFEECAEDIVALLNAGHTLEQAYDKAVYANPVTRAKELERQRKADAEALRARAKEEAEKARNASRTNVNSRDTRRAPTASKANNWEDTLHETMQEIKNRAH